MLASAPEIGTFCQSSPVTVIAWLTLADIRRAAAQGAAYRPKFRIRSNNIVLPLSGLMGFFRTSI
jgi:hypothetical protein